jgi:MOSC domain-containing protein YiiM
VHCPTCLFDAAAWTDEDLVRTLDAFPLWWRALAAGADAAVLAPYREVVSALPRRVADAGAVHRGWHALADAGRALHLAGLGARTRTGTVAQVSVSDGGVPKLPLPRAEVTVRGLVGDRQAERRHHGRPWQALCLWSAEVVDGLAAEGHPLGYGSAGENLTLRGLDWSQVRPGVRLQVGTALVETTALTIPCRKNGRWFHDGRPTALGRRGASRIYARVLAEGSVAPGDDVVVEPAVVPVQPRRTGVPSRV